MNRNWFRFQKYLSQIKSNTVATTLWWGKDGDRIFNILWQATPPPPPPPKRKKNCHQIFVTPVFMWRLSEKCMGKRSSKFSGALFLSKVALWVGGGGGTFPLEPNAAVTVTFWKVLSELIYCTLSHSQSQCTDKNVDHFYDFPISAIEEDHKKCQKWLWYYTSRISCSRQFHVSISAFKYM